jgi:hypothetical protein
MDNENILPDIGLDPSKWTEPTEQFFGKIIECGFGSTDDSKGKDGRTFTESRGLPRPIKTFRAVIERLDAVYDLDDGTSAPVHVYLSLDLERYVDGKFIPANLNKGSNKATFTLTKWNENGVRLAPDPTVNVGKICEFERLRSKLFGNVAAKDITYPLNTLPDNYVFTGEMRHFKPKSSSLDDAAASVEASTPAAVAAAYDEDELVALLVDVVADDVAALTQSKAFEYVSGEARVKLVDGDLQKGLVAAGKLVVIDGKYALPS